MLAALAASFSALLAGATWWTAARTKGAKRDVDAIRVTQDTLIETINFLRKENGELREGVARCQIEVLELRERLRKLNGL